MTFSKLIVGGLFLFVSVQAFAKYTYIDGTVADVDGVKKTISIVADDNGEKKTYRYSKHALVEVVGAKASNVRRLTALREGEKVTLKVK